MPDPNDNSDPLTDEEALKMLLEMDIDQWLEKMRRADRSFYNIMALEVWSIAKTMDGLVPGFWSRFMNNRQIALKQHMQQKQQRRTGTEREPENEEADEETQEPE